MLNILNVFVNMKQNVILICVTLLQQTHTFHQMDPHAYEGVYQVYTEKFLILLKTEM